VQSKAAVQIGIISSIVVIFIMISANTLLSLSKARKEPNIIDGLASWWLAKAYFAEANPPDIVVLGGSQLASVLGADAYVYDRVIDITDDHRSYVLEHDLHALLNKHLSVFVAALPEAMISDQLVINPNW
jgi:hypothetical protein